MSQARNLSAGGILVNDALLSRPHNDGLGVNERRLCAATVARGDSCLSEFLLAQAEIASRPQLRKSRAQARARMALRKPAGFTKLVRQIARTDKKTIKEINKEYIWLEAAQGGATPRLAPIVLRVYSQV